MKVSDGCCLTDIPAALESVPVETSHVSYGSPLGLESGTPGPVIDTRPSFRYKFRFAANVANVPYLTCGSGLYVWSFYRLTFGKSTSVPLLPWRVTTSSGIEYEVDLRL